MLEKPLVNIASKKNNGKSPFLIGKSTPNVPFSIAIVKLPEGNMFRPSRHGGDPHPFAHKPDHSTPKDPALHGKYRSKNGAFTTFYHST